MMSVQTLGVLIRQFVENFSGPPWVTSSSFQERFLKAAKGIIFNWLLILNIAMENMAPFSDWNKCVKLISNTEDLQLALIMT